ncbi:MAG: response regulator [Acidobacteriota bacterium]|nr:response regulator [Acidobacteriota bacterium]
MNTHNKFTVLYADDDEDSCTMLSTLLGYSEIDVSCAHTVKEAFLSAQTKKFDLFLLASRFDDGSGEELCRGLREFDSQTPIMFFSGDASETDRRNGIAAGAMAYFAKPDSETVAETITRLSAQRVR